MGPRSFAASLSLSVVALVSPLLGQGIWTVSFDHIPNDLANPPGVVMVHPASDSISNPSQWITLNPPLPGPTSPTPHQGMNTVHVSLIPAGIHRGEVLVWDGNLTNYGTRTHQPWAIVNPYWPAANPNYWPGQPATQYRFHNGLLAMPAGKGELFCAGQCWMSDGRLMVAGGTKRYPLHTGGWFEGTNLLYQWDSTPQAGNPFGRWVRMTDLEVDRWYPTVTRDGTQNGAIVIGGTNWTAVGGTQAVNSYEVARIQFNAVPLPLLLPPPNDFDRKPAPGTQPTWPGTLPPLSQRQYWGPILPTAMPMPGFDDYPRIHVLGILDPMPVTIGSSPRIFVSGFNAWGIRWVHDTPTDPAFATVLGGTGFDLGQTPAFNDTRVAYATSLLLPTTIGGISSQVARIGGERQPSTGTPSAHVETASVATSPSSWISGPGSMPSMNHARRHGNVVMLPNGELFAIGGVDASLLPVQTPELLVGGTTWVDMAPHAGARDYHSAAILLPDGRVFVCGGELRKWPTLPPPGPGKDYAIWEPPYFHLDYGSVPPTGITIFNTATALPVPQDQIGGLNYGQHYDASWTNALEPGIEVGGVVLMRPAALTHHDDGGQRLVRLAMEQNPDNPSSVLFKSPSTTRVADTGWWMLFLVTTSGRPSLAYWVNLQ